MRQTRATRRARKRKTRLCDVVPGEIPQKIVSHTDGMPFDSLILFERSGRGGHELCVYWKRCG